jgi:hypothetical protein
MTSRFGWVLFGTALGIASVPGCELFRNTTNVTVTHDVGEFILPPDPVPIEPAVGKATLPVAQAAEPDPANPGAVTTGLTPFLMVKGGPGPSAGQTAKSVDTPLPSIPPEKESPDAPRKMYGPTESCPKLAPLVQALQAILDDRHEEALKHLQGYDAKTQEFYLRILPTLTIFAKKQLDQLSPQEVAVLYDQLQSLQAAIRPRTELTIDTMCYCAGVKSFGIYQPVPGDHAFVAPAPDRPGEQVQLYVELRNFACVPRGGGYETRLRSTIEIRELKEGKPLRTITFDRFEAPLKSLSRLNDYYNHYFFSVPDLPPGTYQLVLEIADETIPEARRVAHRSLEFRVTPVGR